jgi:hypothetical protein
MINNRSNAKQPLAKLGDFLETKLDNSYFAYARMLGDTTSVLLYDNCYSTPCTNLEELDMAPVLMQLSVFSYTFKKRVWPVIGWGPLTTKWDVEPTMWKREQKYSALSE